ncbi:DUF6049 family protein [Bombiscardovia coagulans]|uniref:Uncharacterized protein n=1 Tax=Bombiscardovia coagulans TaxID=686666 RepID=A0A261EQR3_9BIFI|nr:DUF6049 family protein [Bombiscardovia coagulans]OZG49185.1 hypothetical protein BOCO_0994 [Bombiscardovia coagulans]
MNGNHAHNTTCQQQNGRTYSAEGLRPQSGIYRRRTVAALITVLVFLCSFVFVAVKPQAEPISPIPAYAANTRKGNNEHPRISSSVKLSIRSSTAVVSSTSGYSVKVAVTNTSNKASGTGKLSVDTNALYSFSSRVDMQDWAEGDSRIPTPNHLSTTDVASIQPGQSIEVTATTPAEHDQLKAMNTWGPKPLLLTYTSDETDPAGKHVTEEATTFLTRSPDGLTTAHTPAMPVSMVLPLASTDWEVNQDRVKELMTGQGDNKQAPPANNPGTNGSQDHDQKSPIQHTPSDLSERIVQISQSGVKAESHRQQLLAHHSKLNTVADPLYSSYLDSSVRVDAGMQPGVFDITAYSPQDAAHYSSAGVEMEDWSAQTASHELKSGLHTADTSKPIYAWQGSQPWSLANLTEARKQGYTTVIAPRGLDSEAGSPAHTGKYTVSTEAGEITLLSAQRELSTLAQGNPTSAKAASEQTSAGQVARFMAQSAFYQSEQPYAQRNILICFGSNQDIATAGTLMTAVEGAPWLRLDDLHTVSNAEPYSQGEEARELITGERKSNPFTKAKTSGLNGTLDSLAASRNDIKRFSTAMLATQQQNRSSPSASSGKSDAQALARQDAADTARRSNNPSQWLADVTHVHDSLALHALASTDKAGSLADDARALVDQLLNGVQIKPSESITVVSETAKMPVTVSNTHPYPVAVRVSSKTDSMEIVTTRTTDALIPANSEAQVTFTIRVATAGQADAEISLVDQDNVSFGETRTTHITSNLRLSDMSGLLIIVLALLFGALGVWRQINRTKDPDE